MIGLEARGEAAFAAYAAAYEQRRAAAVANFTCFCVCGCGNRVEHLSPVIDGPVRCTACRRGGRKVHFLTPRPRDSFDWTPYEPARTLRPRRIVTAQEQVAAETYVRKASRRGFKVLARLRDRVETGHALTPGETEQALRSKAADVRAAGVARRLIGRVERRFQRKIDLARIRILDSVADGNYAVRDDTGGLVRIRIERPKSGRRKGFVVVTFEYGEETIAQGLQWPQPARLDRPEWWQYYQGPSAHLVARLVGNPDEARTLYKQALQEDAA